MSRPALGTIFWSMNPTAFVGMFWILLASAVTAVPAENRTFNAPTKLGRRCTGQIQSLDDVAAAEECTTIVIGNFTVPAGKTFALAPPDGASISLAGDVTFGFKEWNGPLMTITGNNITFNGNSNELLGQGDLYWDGLGGSGGVLKPDLMLRLKMSGSFSNLKIVNSPRRAISIAASSLIVSCVDVDNSAGSVPNSRSGSKSAGANTDGFDISADDVTIESSRVANQDDCLAIESGSNIVFKGNTCIGGHGISVGSINSNVVVSNVQITGNTVISNINGLRIKTDATSTASTVANIVYSNNTLSGITSFGVLVDQSYPAILGTPGTGVVISTVTFSGTNTISVEPSAKRVEVNCGSTSSCDGTWDWSGLTVTGGVAGAVEYAPVTGGSF
ncbi:glycosyl hydrolases family 28-domain-containing protein [Mycena sp. CBHHK59/15]|nr:glycosyl hydrolases family 28-domain-containing protein [Mycena sp. CBHHK59/15]